MIVCKYIITVASKSRTLVSPIHYAFEPLMLLPITLQLENIDFAFSLEKILFVLVGIIPSNQDVISYMIVKDSTRVKIQIEKLCSNSDSSQSIIQVLSLLASALLDADLLAVNTITFSVSLFFVFLLFIFFSYSFIFVFVLVQPFFIQLQSSYHDLPPCFM